MSDVTKLKIGNTSYNIKDSNACKQVITMPTANESNLDKVVQYVGNTTATYTNGYFYKCISDGAATPTYSWQNINVQEGGSSSDPAVFTITLTGDGDETPYSVDKTPSEVTEAYRAGKEIKAIYGSSIYDLANIPIEPVFNFTRIDRNHIINNNFLEISIKTITLDNGDGDPDIWSYIDHTTERNEFSKVTDMPTAWEHYLGMVYQYIGATTSNYIHGYFYECVSDGAATPTYSWQRINVQPTSVPADNVSYDNTESSLTADNVKDAIDELTERIVVLEDYERLDDVLGLEIDYDNNTFTRLAAARGLNAGNDFNQFSIYQNIKRCNVDSSGNVTHYRGSSGYSEETLTMVEFQPYYYRFEPLKTTKATKGLHVNKARYYISGTPHAGFKPMPWFVRNGQIDVAYYSAFNGNIYDVSASAKILDDAQIMDASTDYLYSMTGAKPASGLSQNLIKANLEKMANNLMSGAHLTTIQAEMAITWLMMIEYGVLDFQRTSLGRGVVSKASGSGNESEISGQAVVNANGSTYASDTTGLVPACWRWVENPYGNIWNNIQGINIFGDGTMLGGEPFICTDFNFDESKHADNYVGAGFYIPNTNGYIKYFGYGNPDLDWLLLPSAIGGSDALPVGDYNWKTDNLNGLRIALLGSAWNYGLLAGRSSWDFAGAVGYRTRNVGGRLEYRKGAI